MCRRLVAVHCLYGVDWIHWPWNWRNCRCGLNFSPKDLPLTFLDHRLIAGDFIAGPFFHDLSRLPVGGRELDPLLARGVTERLGHLIVR